MHRGGVVLMFTLIRYTLHRLDNGTPPSKPRGLAVTMARLAGKLQDTSGPYIIRQDKDSGPDRSLLEMLRIVRKRMRRGEVGTRLLVIPASGPTWAIRKVQIHPKITDTQGVDAIDLIWTMVLKKWPGIANLGICNCRHILNSSSWSLHAWCQAWDVGSPNMTLLKEIADWVIEQNAPGQMFAGLCCEVIVDKTIWTPEEGKHPYTGAQHFHTHIGVFPRHEGQTPPCA
jgi:hypothetical protein